MSTEALRQRAEAQAAANAKHNQIPQSPAEAAQLLEELRVHQIELEMQNEELRRTQEELDAARARYFDLYDLAPVGYVTLSEQGLICEANLTAATLLGVARSALVKQPFTHFMLRDDQDIYYLHRKALFETGAPQTCDLRMVKSDGAIFWARLEGSITQGAAIPSAGQTPAGAAVCLVTLSDITGRKRAEQQLRESETNLRKAQTVAHVGSWVWRIPTNQLEWSEQMFEIFGIAKATFTGNLTEVIARAIHPDDRAAVERSNSSVIHDGKPVPVEYRVVWPDGTVRVVWGEAGELTFDAAGAPLTLSGIVQDITERAAAAEALRVSEAQLRVITESARDAIVLLDAAAAIRYWNPAAEQMFGYTKAEALGCDLGDLLVPEPYLTQFRAAFPEFARTGRGRAVGQTLEMAGRRKDGAIIPVELSLSALQIENAWHSVGVVRDITARKLAHDKLRDTLADLQRSNADLEQFAYVASHDLQEPLRMVTSFVQLLAKRYRGQLDADADEFIGYAVEGAKRMQQLILDLLEYSHVGTRGEAPQPTDATAVCQAVIQDLEVAITEAGATVICDPLPTVLADPSQLHQLFQNLIANAIKFRGAEPPVVHVSARTMDDGRSTMDDGRSTHIEHRTSNIEHRQSEWVFSVRDNGIGMEPQFFERIFVIFQRLHSRGEYPGTGIGLAVCKKIVERHGGRIWVESAPGRGSTFYFTLPAVA